MTSHIESRQNQNIKLVRSLSLKKHRAHLSLFVAEGLKVIATAMENDWAPTLLLTDDAKPQHPLAQRVLAWASKSGAQSFTTSQTLLHSLCSTENPQDMLAVFPQRWRPIREAKPAPKGLWIALEEIRDAGNLGTIIRTADAVGAEGIILVGECCDPYATKSVRATMGAIFSVPIVRASRAEFAELLGIWPGDRVGAHLQGKVDFRRVYRKPTLLMMGSEGNGLSQELASQCDALIKVPMRGKSDSLNVSIATALITYEIMRDLLPPAGAPEIGTKAL